MFGNEIYRVTVRKDEYHEVENKEDGTPAWICNTCRFEKKDVKDWTIQGPRKMEKWSVINQGKYMKQTAKVEIDTEARILYGRQQDRKAISMNGTNTPEQILSNGK